MRRYLRVYTNSVLSLSRSCSEAGTLGELRRVAAPLMEQVTFLARVCAVEEGGLPAGVALLSRLLDVSVHVSNIAQHHASPLVLQKVPSEANPKVRNHGEGPY